ncbi:MAG: PEGA domain-containing protein [Myxococcales bacterium]|nr:PEGA domain-containing protein [Myxococcales bacterium]
MECAEVEEAIRVGDEGPAVLDHLAHCPSCRASGESTLFTDTMETDERPAARASGKLPWIVAAALVPVVVLLAVVVVMRRAPAVVEMGAPPEVPPVITPLAAPAPILDRKEAVSPVAAPATGKVVGNSRRAASSESNRPERKASAAARAEGAGAALPRPPSEAQDEVAEKPTAGRAPVADRGDTVPAEPPAQAPEKREEKRARITDDDVPVAASVGYLTITTDPWAKVIIDGRDIGRTTPLTRYTTPAGHHTVELRARTGTVTVEVDVKAKQELAIDRAIE